MNIENTNISQGTSQEDDDWFASLSGTQMGSDEREVQKEARILRRVILKKHSEIVAKAVDEAELQQFRDRLRRENLCPEPFYRQPRAWAMAASLILCVGLGIAIQPMIFQNDSTMEELRGVDSDITIISVDNQKTATNQLTQQLAELGIVAKVSRHQGDLLLDAYVPAEQEEAVNALLRSTGGRVENKGRLRLYFRQGKK